MAARKKEEGETPEGYTLLESPTGARTSVPEDIKESLIDSGYKPVK